MLRAVLQEPAMQRPQMNASTEKRGGIEVRKADGEIDEIVCDSSCRFYLEQMDTGHWWIEIVTLGGQSLHINLSTRRGAKIRAFAEFQ
jgi:hypothetical protein